VEMPSSSRQSGTPNDDRPTLVDGTAVPAQHRTDASAVPMRTRDDETTVSGPSLGERLAAATAPGHRTDTDRTDTDRTLTDRTMADQSASERAAASARDEHADAERAAERAAADRAATERAATERAATDADRTPTVTGPKPRASLLATLGLITGVVSALLVLSGPLAGYGVVLAVVALLLSIGGIRATRRRHVAGKSDALIGMLVALGAIVVGMLALTGSLSWLGTDMNPVSQLREWLDARFVDRF
jgi:hypothetical protein